MTIFLFFCVFFVFVFQSLFSRCLRQERHQALMSLMATARGGVDMRNAIMQEQLLAAARCGDTGVTKLDRCTLGYYRLL